MVSTTLKHINTGHLAIPAGWCWMSCASPAGSGHDIQAVSLVRASTWISRIPKLAVNQSLKAQMGCKTLPGVLGLAVAPASRSCAALSDSKSARLGSGAALQQFTCTLAIYLVSVANLSLIYCLLLVNSFFVVEYLQNLRADFLASHTDMPTT